MMQCKAFVPGKNIKNLSQISGIINHAGYPKSRCIHDLALLLPSKNF
jgi:hypothetical protein